MQVLTTGCAKMDTALLKPEEIHSTKRIKLINDYCDQGLYLDALDEAQSQWGNIHTWQGKNKLLIAIRITEHLGSQRRADAILLHLWRNNKFEAEVLSQVFFYQWSTLGPILTMEWLADVKSYFQRTSKDKAVFYAMRSALLREMKHFSLSETLLDKAIQLDDKNTWFTILKIRTLVDQEQFDDAKQLVNKYYAKYPSANSLRLKAYVLEESEDFNASLTFISKDNSHFQSASLLLQLAHMQSINHDYNACQATLCRYLEIRISSDKSNEQLLISLQGQIAIEHGNTDLAVQILKDHKRYYWKSIAQNIQNSKGNKNSKLLNVPFLRQTHLTCAPTTLAAISQYWGFNHNSNEIAEQICFNGTPSTLQRKWLRDHDFKFIEFELNVDLAYALIDQGVPFTLVTTAGFNSHLQAVCGYDKQLGTLSIMDPSSSVKQEVLAQESIDSEAYLGAHCCAIVPQDKTALLADLTFPASELFVLLDKFQNADNNRDFNLAQQALDEMIQLSPTHRITLQTKRAVAIENGDTKQIQDVNLQLLSRYPNETLLHNSLLICGKQLGTQEQSINELAEYLKHNTDHDLLVTYFTEIYNNNSQIQEIENTVYKLKQQAYHSDRAIYALANYYWSIQDHITATEYYLIAHCMDDTNNRYVESYFKAARYLGQQNEALATLKLRYEKYKRRSISPAISLYHAYELLDLENQGLIYLYDALSIHPDDKDLIDVIAHKLITLQKFAKLESLQPIIEKSLSKNDFNEIKARTDSKQGRIEEALTYYQAMYKQSPFITRFANNYFSLLERNNNQTQINHELDALHQNHKTNTLVLDYIIDWHSDDLVKQDAFISMLTVRPNYSDVRRQYIDLLEQLGKHQEALKIAEASCKLVTNEVQNTAYLANCYLSNNLINEAKQTARKVLSNNVDNKLAFDTLLNACSDDIETLNALEFVLAKMKSQVMFGDAAWHFWFKAKTFASNEMLSEFIDYIIKHYPHQWSTYSIASMYYMQLNETNQASEILQKGITKFPLVSRLYCDQACIHEAQGEPDKAIEQYKIALQNDSSCTDIAIQLVQLLETRNQFDDAAVIIKHSLKYNFSDGSLHGYLADIYIQQGNEEAALDSLSCAVEQFDDYLWAWDKIVTVAASLNAKNKLDTDKYAYQLAKGFTDKTPHLAQRWCALAYVSDDADEKLQHLETALQCNIRYLPAHREKIMLSMNIGDYRTAQTLVMTTPWGDNLPMALIPIKFDILERSGQHRQAISYLKKTLSKTCGYSHLWRKLYKLLEKNENSAEIIVCSKIQAALNPHDPDVLSQTGENLIKYGNQQTEKTGDEYLFKAYQLAPNDENIVITYADRLANRNKLEQALRVLTTLEKSCQSSYVTSRKIQILSQRQRHNEALALLKPMLALREESYWVVDTAFTALSEHFDKDQLLTVFSSQLKDLNEVQTYYWAEQQCEHNKNAGVRKVVSALDIVEHHSAWSTLFTALFDYWDNNDLTPPAKLIKKYKPKLETDPDLVAHLNYTYLEKQKYYSVIETFERIKDKTLLPTYAFHHYIHSLQMVGKWDKTLAPLEQSLTLNVDNGLDTLKLWHVFEQFRTTNSLDPVDLDMINKQELNETDQYVHCLLTVIKQLGTASLDDKKDELSPFLRNCQCYYQQTVGALQANFAKKIVKAHLKQAISSNKFIDRMKLKWWISNHF